MDNAIAHFLRREAVADARLADQPRCTACGCHVPCGVTFYETGAVILCRECHDGLCACAMEE